MDVVGENVFGARAACVTGVIDDGLSKETKELLFVERRKPRSKDKPVIR